MTNAIDFLSQESWLAAWRFAAVSHKVPASLENAPTIANPVLISCSLKIGVSALLPWSLETSRFRLATVVSAFLPVSACCFWSSVMQISAPLIPDFVVLLASPLAFIATGGVAEKPFKLGKVLPGV